MSLTDDQLKILRHMLGFTDLSQRVPVAHRDYYCANIGDLQLKELAAVGAVQLYRVDSSYEWYTTTDAGKAAAYKSHRKLRYSKGKRVYLRFLDIKDALCDLTFKEFLTSNEFKEARQSA